MTGIRCVCADGDEVGRLVRTDNAEEREGREKGWDSEHNGQTRFWRSRHIISLCKGGNITMHSG